MKYIILLCFVTSFLFALECGDRDKWGYKREWYYPCGNCPRVCISQPEYYGITGPQYKEMLRRDSAKYKIERAKELLKQALAELEK